MGPSSPALLPATHHHPHPSLPSWEHPSPGTGTLGDGTASRAHRQWGSSQAILVLRGLSDKTEDDIQARKKLRKSCPSAGCNFVLNILFMWGYGAVGELMELQKDPSILLMDVFPPSHCPEDSSEPGPPCFPCLHPKAAAIYPAAS